MALSPEDKKQLNARVQQEKAKIVKEYKILFAGRRSGRSGNSGIPYMRAGQALIEIGSKIPKTSERNIFLKAAYRRIGLQVQNRGKGFNHK